MTKTKTKKMLCLHIHTHSMAGHSVGVPSSITTEYLLFNVHVNEKASKLAITNEIVDSQIPVVVGNLR